MEQTFPGVQVYIACREDSTYVLRGEERILTKNELKDSRHLFGYVRELLCDMQSNPVEEFMKESDIPCGPVKETPRGSSGRCVLVTNGVLPVKSLTGDQIKAAIQYIRGQGCEPDLNDTIDNAAWVVGVESESLYQAAANGLRVTLIPTGFGKNLFKKMFPTGQILELPA